MIPLSTQSGRSPGAEPVIDMQQLLGRCLGNVELAERSLERFAQRLAADVECVLQFADSDDRTELGQLAHRIKGSAATVAATKLAAAAAALEDYARGRSEVEAADVVARFLHEVERFLDVAPRFDLAGPSPD